MIPLEPILAKIPNDPPRPARAFTGSRARTNPARYAGGVSPLIFNKNCKPCASFAQ